MVREPGPISLRRYDFEPSYSGIQTFLKSPICLTISDLIAGDVDVAIGGVPWDGTVVTRSGTHMAPMAIRSCEYLSTRRDSSLSHLHVRTPLEHLRVVDYGDAEVIPGNLPGTFDNVRAFVGEILQGEAVPVIVGGDHAITWPNVTAVADHFGYGRVGVVHFDAHADTAPNLPGALSGHGSPMRQLIESGAVLGRNFVQIGLRGYWPGPKVVAWMEEREMRTHFMAEIDRFGFDCVLDRAIAEALDGPEHLFLSIDVDVVDPAFAPGTGSPEPGGLSSRQLLRGIRRLAHEVGIVGMDIVEVSPPYDAGNNITCLLAHRALLEALTGLAMKRAGIAQPDYLDPRAAEGPPNEGSR